MRPLVAALAFSTVLLASGADTPKIPRAKIANAEKLINTQIAAMYPEEPYFILGLARGVYLDGVGAVFSIDINLAMGPSLSPFKQTVTKEEVQRHREKKEQRLPILRTKMKDVVTSLGTLLDSVPVNEEYVFIVTMWRYPYEEPAGMPTQIVMRVKHGQLIQAAKGIEKLDSVIRTQEF